jgi:predicted RNA-binding protein (virulence factor B family)
MRKKQSQQQKSDNLRDSKYSNGAIQWEQPALEREALKKGNEGFHEGQKVQLLISGHTHIGFLATVNGGHQGILYKNQVFQPLRKGQEIDGFIRKLREDGKIDLCLQKPGYKAIDFVSGKILDQLRSHDGSIPITDKSSPKAVGDYFGISKKTFKKAIGKLYKKRLIVLEKESIRLRWKSEKDIVR